MHSLLRFVGIVVVAGVLTSAWAQPLELNANQSPDFGEFIVGIDGASVYATTQDAPGEVLCVDACAAYWPIVTSDEIAIAGEGVSESLIGEVTRPDGTVQITYGGWPLYYFSYDPAPGATRGQGNANVWYLVSVSGDLVGHESAETVAEPEVEEAVVVTDAFELLMQQGEEVYARVCAACHGPAGEGGVGVRLISNSRLADAESIADAVLNGLAYMPPQRDHLTVEEAAAVLTFIRNSWDNSFGEVSVETVEGVMD